jgi:hypothetical protein
MTAAVALAVVLVIAVAGLSLAMQTQRPVGSSPGRTRPQVPNPRRPRERKAQPAASTPEPAQPPKRPEPEPKGPELLRTGTRADAKVVSVVDERTVGPVTRSRLVLAITPSSGETFEVTTRAAFPSPAARSSVKVGGTVPVRYDPGDHGRVVLDLPKDDSPKKAAGDDEAAGES